MRLFLIFDWVLYGCFIPEAARICGQDSGFTLFSLADKL
jgi:hypothetical protein